MATTSKNRRALSPEAVLHECVEPRRKTARISLRAAAGRANMSEGTWRQLVANGVNVRGTWVTRTPRRDQVLDMARAVGALDEAAELLGATDDEVQDSKLRVIILDPAEEEIMGMRALRPTEKLHLLEELRNLRQEQ